MRRIVGLLAIYAVVSGCAALPVPVTSGVPTTCADRLTEPSCKEGQRCSWINDYRRSDGTYATAHCTEAGRE
jgi:hypothetical protein